MSYDWITDFKPAQSDGTLPVTGNASAMRYRRAVIWQVDLMGFGIGGRSLKGSWDVTIESPGGTVLFHQIVEVELFFVYLSLPGIAFYTWNYVKDNAAGKATDIIDGKTIGQDEIGDYLLGGLIQGSMEPASGQGNTDLTATIMTDWISPGYVFPGGIPAGSKVKIKADNWNFGPASVEYSWAFDQSAVLQSLVHPTTGQTFLLHVADGDLKLARTRRGQPKLELREPPKKNEEDKQEQAARCDFEAALSPQKLVPGFGRLYRRNGALYCVALADKLKLFRSDDDGENWKELASMPGEELNITISACAFDGNGATLYLYGTTTKNEPEEEDEEGDKDNKDKEPDKEKVKLKKGRPMFVEVKNQGESWKVSARAEVKDGDKPPPDDKDKNEPEPGPGDDPDELPPAEEENKLPTDNIAGLEYAGGRLYLTVKSGENGLSLYVSNDGLRSLKKLEFS